MMTKKIERVLMVASEAHPLVKTGGLADVIGSLPRALKANGVDCRVILPKYKDIPADILAQAKTLYVGEVDLAWRRQYLGLEVLTLEETTFYLVDNLYYFDRAGLYGHIDEAERFAYFARAVLALLKPLSKAGFRPEVIHCHDWQSSLLPLYLKTFYRTDPFYQDFKSVLTIHNLKYQGVYGADIIGDVLGLSVKEAGPLFDPDGDVNFLQGGILTADRVTTVSKSYAQEIQGTYFGEGLGEVLSARPPYGIVNGIDYRVFNPKTDTDLKYTYEASSARAAKAKNKADMQAQLGLPVKADIPLISFVSRLVEQKGLDLILALAEEIGQRNCQLVFLGDGEEEYQTAIHDLARAYPDKVSANSFYDEAVAHRIYAASDMMLMPSKFEPCGLSQLIAMRYGTIPIVRTTGGLADTVSAFNPVDKTGTGFTFYTYNAHELLAAIDRALDAYQNKEDWQRLVKNAMGKDHSWKHSAKEYVRMYRSLFLDPEKA